MNILAKDGTRVKLIRGEKDWHGPGKDSECGEWIAGSIPVGSTGTVRLAADIYPFAKHMISYCIIWDHNPTPREGYYWGLGTVDGICYLNSKSWEVIDN